MTRRLISVLAILCFLISLAACGAELDAQETQPPVQNPEPQPVQNAQCHSDAECPTVQCYCNQGTTTVNAKRCVNYRCLTANDCKSMVCK